LDLVTSLLFQKLPTQGWVNLLFQTNWGLEGIERGKFEAHLGGGKLFNWLSSFEGIIFLGGEGLFQGLP